MPSFLPAPQGLLGLFGALSTGAPSTPALLAFIEGYPLLQVLVPLGLGTAIGTIMGWVLASHRGAPHPVPHSKGNPQTDSELPTCFQLIRLDISAVASVLSGLRKQGVSTIAAYIEIHPELLLQCQKLTRVTWVNPRALHYAGLGSLEEFQDWFTLQNTPPWNDILRRQLFMLWSSQQENEEEISFHGAHNEELCWYIRNSMPLKLGAPDPSRVEIVIVDLTIAIGTAKLRYKGADIMRDVFANSNLLIWWARVRRDGKNFLWRMHLPEHSEHSPIYRLAGGRAKGGLWDMDTMPDAKAMNARAEAALLNGERGYMSEFRATANDGIHWLREHVIIQPLGPDAWSVIGNASDITEQRQTEQALATERERLSVTLSAMLECVITTNADGLIQYMNRAAGTLTQCDASEAQGLHLDQVLKLRMKGAPDRAGPRFGEMLEKLSTVAIGSDHILLGREGRETPVEGRLVPVCNPMGGVVGSVLVLRDESEHQRLATVQQRTEKLESASVVASTIAHDFNNILAGMLGNLELLRSETPHDSPIDALLTGALNGALRARELTRQLIHTIPAPQVAPPALPEEPATGPQPPNNAPSSLPQSPAPIPDSLTTAAAPLSQPSRGRVLLMDDETSILKIGGRMLAKLGFEVDLARDGSEAIELYAKAHAAGHPHALVMMDLSVPSGMGGREALSALLKINPNVRALVSSGYSDDASVAEHRILGFKGMVAKPYQIAELAEAIDRVLPEP